MRTSRRGFQILQIVREEGTSTITGLANQLEVSQETIRRDIRPLEAGGELLKMHGSVALPYQVGEALFERRLRENAAAKKAIARQVATYIQDGSSVMLDHGTTTSLLARELLKKRQLTIVTNSSDIARTLATVNGNRVFMAGGELKGDSGAAFGASAIEFVQHFKVRHSIISIGAIDAQAGLMDYQLEEAEFARMVLTRGEQALIITDHSKFGKPGLVNVCDFADVDRLVTDRQPDAEFTALLEAGGVELDVVTI